MNIFGDLSIVITPAGQVAVSRDFRSRVHDEARVRDAAMLRLWALGMDTAAIATRLVLLESRVANRLAWLRDAAVRS